MMLTDDGVDDIGPGCDGGVGMNECLCVGVLEMRIQTAASAAACVCLCASARIVGQREPYEIRGDIGAIVINVTHAHI